MPPFSESRITTIMFYLSLVLLSTFVISTIIYILQLAASPWGPAMDRQRQSCGMDFFKKNIRKNKKSKKETSKSETKEVTDVIEANNKSKEEQENLQVTIISNKKPILEKIETKNEVKEKKQSRLRRIFSCFRIEKNRPVNIPRREWAGPSDCTINKDVKLFSALRVSKHSGNNK